MKAIPAKTAALWAATGLIALLGMLAAFVANPASASVKDGGTASSSVTSVVFKQVSLKGLVVADEHIKVDHKSPTKGARWFPTCMNSSTVLGQYHGSHIVQYKDHHCLLQPDSHSPTGWVKRGGGASNRDCRNIAAPPAVKMPYPKVKHYISVESFSKLFVKVYVTATAHASIHASCGNAEGSGSASDWIRVTYRDLVRAQSNTQLREQLAASIVIKAKDAAVAKATVTCTTPSTTTTQTTTTVVTTTTTPTTTTTTTTTTPAPPTFTMSFDTINDIPAGTCRPEVLHVTSSVTGQVQVSPDKGLISPVDCYRPDNEQLSLVKLPVNTGSQDLTVYVYEPTDSSATSDTLTAVPLVAGVDAKNNTVTTSFTVSHPIRP